MSFTWRGDEFKKHLEDDLNKKLARVGILLSNEIKREISIKVDKHGGQEVRSSPGEPPRVDSGLLRNSIAWEVDSDKQVVRVGTGKLYGKFLQLGTKSMAPRDFLMRSLNTMRGVITEILKEKHN